MARFGRSFPVPRLRRFSLSSTNVSISVSVLSAVFSIISPTVNTTRNVIVSPSAISYIASIPTPTYSTQESVTPATIEGVFTLLSPTISVGEAILVSTVSSTFTLNEPSIITENNSQKAQGIIVTTETKPGAFIDDDGSSMMFLRDNNKPRPSMV